VPESEEPRDIGKGYPDSNWRWVYVLVVLFTVALIIALGLFSYYFSS